MSAPVFVRKWKNFRSEKNAPPKPTKATDHAPFGSFDSATVRTNEKNNLSDWPEAWSSGWCLVDSE